MTPEQQAAYVFAQAVSAMAEIEGMKAENEQRKNRFESPAYTEDDFMRVPEKHSIDYNSVIGLYRGLI